MEQFKDYKDEAFINDLVDQYKTTQDEGLRLSLIACFDPYFKKYANLFCGTNSVDLTNKDTLKFLRCFMTAEERESDFKIVIAARKVVTFIRSLFKDSVPQDLYDETLCGFLEHLNRYKPMIATHTQHKSRISFTHFIQVNVRWHLVGVIQKRAKDAMYRSSNLEFNDNIFTQDSQEPGVNWSPIDLRWVHGATTGDVFSCLTEMDRYLLFLKYEEENKSPLSDYDLARLTGLDRMYVRRKMLKIKAQLKELVEVM
jgi:hypothetical protein